MNSRLRFILIALLAFSAGGSQIAGGADAPPALDKANAELLRDLRQGKTAKVRKILDARGRLLRVEVTRRGGISPDEIVTFPSRDVTVRERDEDGDGHFEERRIERRDQSVQVERRTSSDPKWRLAEVYEFDLGAGLVRGRTYDPAGERVIATGMEPLWSSESYSEAFDRCLTGELDADSCPAPANPLVAALPLPPLNGDQSYEDDMRLNLALQSMRGEACNGDPDFLYTGTGYYVDRRSCGNDPVRMDFVVSAANAGVAGLFRCFSPNSTGNPNGLQGRIHYPSQAMTETLALTFYEHVETSGGIRLECSSPGASGSITSAAAADASWELNRIRFNDGLQKETLGSVMAAEAAGHEFLHMSRILGARLEIDNQDVDHHNRLDGLTGIQLREKDRVYGCTALCLGHSAPTRRMCELCLDRDPQAASQLCRNLPSESELTALRETIPRSIYDHANCRMPTPESLGPETLQDWNDCLRKSQKAIEAGLDQYAQRPYADPRWEAEIDASRRLLSENASTRMGYPICMALQRIGRRAVECRVKRDQTACRQTIEDLKSDPAGSRIWQQLDAAMGKVSIRTRQLLPTFCEAG